MPELEKILIVDKNEAYRKSISQFLSKNSFCPHEASSLNEATQRLCLSRYYFMALIRCDCLTRNSPEAILFLKSLNPGLKILLLSDSKNMNMALSLLKKNAIDYASCPEDLGAILSVLKNEAYRKKFQHKNETNKKHLAEVKSKYEQKAAIDESVWDATLENLMTAIDLRDIETYGHSKTVAKYSQTLAQLLGIQDEIKLRNIKRGALLHDIGKIAVPDSILKKPSSLSRQEWKKIKLHPSLGFSLVKEIKMNEEIGNIILYHHERYDGWGYPQKLSKRSIPLEARIFALADTLDAITSKRPYREKHDYFYARQEILNNSGTQFDPFVVNAFCSLDLSKWGQIRFESTRLLVSFENWINAISL